MTTATRINVGTRLAELQEGSARATRRLTALGWPPHKLAELVAAIDRGDRAKVDLLLRGER